MSLNSTALDTWSNRLKSYCEKIFTNAAQIIIWRKVPDEKAYQIIENVGAELIKDDTKMIVPRVVSRLENHLSDISRDAVRADIERRLAHQPLDAIIRNTIDDQLLPQLTPRLERSMRDAEQLIDEKLRRVLRPILEDIVGVENIVNMVAAEVAKVVNDVTDKPASNKPKLHSVAAPKRTAHHVQMRDICKIVDDRNPAIPGSKVLMVGPAGSGKTLIAEDIAEELELPFYFNGPVQSEYKLLGYKDAAGTYHYTPFRKAFEFGGVYLFDEFDACSAQAMVAFNTALSNDYCDFPDRTVKKSKRFVCMAAANTYGRGGTLNYSGRERLDGATLDRFVVVDVKYDSSLEQDLAQDRNWVRRVQQIRNVAADSFPWLIISMRASIEGARLLKKGYDRETVEEAVLWRGQLTKEQIVELTRKIF